MFFKLKHLDCMAPQINLRLNGHTGLRTWFGFLMTVGYLVSTVSLSTVLFLTYFDTSEPGVNQQQTESSIYPRISLADNKLFPVVYVLNNGYLPLKPNQLIRYITPIFARQGYHIDKDQNGTVKAKADVVNMPMIPCKELKKNDTAYQFYKEYEGTEVFSAYAMEYGLCVQVDEKNAYVQGGGADTHLDIVSLDIYPCLLPTGCAPLTELIKTSIIVTSPTNSLNFSNYEKPVKSYVTSDNIYFINPASRAKYSSKLSLNQIIDDRGLLFPKVLRTNYSEAFKIVGAQRFRDPNQLNCTLAQIYPQVCIPYFSFDFSSSGRKVVISRVYKTITKILSEIGGINSIVFVFFFTLNNLYSYFARKNILISSVYGFLDSNKNNKNPKVSAKSDAINLDGSDTGLKSVGWDLGNRAALKKLRTEALLSIEENMDIVTIISEINALKVLTHILLKKHQKTLVPALSLKLDITNRRERHLASEKRFWGRDPVRCPSRIHPLENFKIFELGHLNFTSAMKQLEINCKGNAKISHGSEERLYQVFDRGLYKLAKLQPGQIDKEVSILDSPKSQTNPHLANPSPNNEEPCKLKKEKQYLEPQFKLDKRLHAFRMDIRGTSNLDDEKGDIKSKKKMIMGKKLNKTNGIRPRSPY